MKLENAVHNWKNFSKNLKNSKSQNFVGSCGGIDSLEGGAGFL